MSTAEAIGFGLVAWVALSVVLALFLGRVIQFRERQRPDRTPSVRPPPRDRASAASPRQQSGWDPRDET